MKDLVEGKKEAKGNGYQLSNQQAEEDAIKEMAGYSYLSATIGSTHIARRAGT
jgi:hypothetical protein